MDWLVDPPTAGAASALRTELSSFLRRHAADAAEVSDAEVVIAELLANAVEHAGGPIWVSLVWTEALPVLTVQDLGPSFTPDLSPPAVTSPRGRGLWLVSQLAKDLAVEAKRSRGNRVQATLAVTRRSESSFDPPRRLINPLPTLEEAGPRGFPRESFLRALVVELSRAVTDTHGPLASEEAVARVGATIGGQMEDEFRRARQITGRLTPEQIADCYVRLKAAIDGDFYPISISADRIVLGNRRCPFGDTVRHSPALCRMTSSVFGGIAARNRGQAVVLLDERIAVGDPECRVTVLLNPDAGDRSAGGHRYRADDPVAED
ncbi:ATP-binding protein [Planosporangium thailandense]|uniref:ATP-binding protein n=1 Tax=Planosporangium thailandense TaxID=765197 RepID=A0ABX0Y4V9_9ACTN|nr:ATP-binding protein [Planosporangium thailandense]NJC72432.1 ATP-binding protein [Planosporangium thailandense]